MKLAHAIFLLNLFFVSNMSLQFTHFFGVGYFQRINVSRFSSGKNAFANGYQKRSADASALENQATRRPSRFEIVDCKGEDERECDVICVGDTLNSFITSHQVRLKWIDKPKQVLLLTKFVDGECDVEVYSMLQDAISFLKSEDLDILVEPGVYNCLQEDSADLSNVRMYNSSEKSGIDLLITFGGDGLLMHCNQLFGAERVPPTMCFDFGSLGFLAPFSYDRFREEVKNVLNIILILMR